MDKRRIPAIGQRRQCVIIFLPLSLGRLPAKRVEEKQPRASGLRRAGANDASFGASKADHAKSAPGAADRLRLSGKNATGSIKRRDAPSQRPRSGQARRASIRRLWGRTELQRDGFDALPSSHSPKPARVGGLRRLRPDCPARARQSRELSPEIFPLRLRKVVRSGGRDRPEGGLEAASPVSATRPAFHLSTRRRPGLTACAA